MKKITNIFIFFTPYTLFCAFFVNLNGDLHFFIIGTLPDIGIMFDKIKLLCLTYYLFFVKKRRIPLFFDVGYTSHIIYYIIVSR